MPGSEATAFTREFLTGGFTTDACACDTYGRPVAEVFDPEGESLNVARAESGLGDDRFLDEFRRENPDLAERLETPLESAPNCRASSQPRDFAAAAPTTNAPQPKKPEVEKPKSDCSPCLPIIADLNCSDVPGPVTVTGDDPHRLDNDGGGTGGDT